MSKSRKDRVNYFKHHELRSAYESKKRSIPAEDIPKDVKDDIIYMSNVANRHGNNRQYERDIKLHRARRDRLHRNDDALRQVEEALTFCENVG